MKLWNQAHCEQQWCCSFPCETEKIFWLKYKAIFFFLHRIKWNKISMFFLHAFGMTYKSLGSALCNNKCCLQNLGAGGTTGNCLEIFPVKETLIEFQVKISRFSIHMESTTEDWRNVFRGYVTGRVKGSVERYQRKGRGRGEGGKKRWAIRTLVEQEIIVHTPPQVVSHFLNFSCFTISADLPDEIPPIDQDGLVISFECRPVFSNVMEIKISAHNTNPAPLQEVVMDLQVPTVSCKLSVTLEPQTFLRTVFVVN